MAKAAKSKKEITMEEALWKSADKLRGSRMRCSVSRTFYIMRLLWRIPLSQMKAIYLSLVNWLP